MSDINVDNFKEEFEKTPGAILLDVRTAQEHAKEKLPESINVPVSQIASILEKVPDKTTPVFVYCQSGARSRRAAAFLRESGYERITDMGGISGYKSLLQKGNL